MATVTTLLPGTKNRLPNFVLAPSTEHGYGFCSTYIVVDLGVHMQLIKTWVQHIIYDYSTEVFNPLRCFQVPSDLTLTQTLTIQAASWVILK